jgi:hypothetical protein
MKRTKFFPNAASTFHHKTSVLGHDLVSETTRENHPHPSKKKEPKKLRDLTSFHLPPS